MSEAKQLTRALLDTLSNGHVPAAYGEFIPLVQEIKERFGEGGSEAVQRAVDTWLRMHPELDEVVPGKNNRYHFLNSQELQAIAPPTWLIEDTLVMAEATMMTGDAGSGKTFIAVDFANRVAQHYPVCYIAAEDVHGIKIRKNAWHSRFAPDTSNFYTIPEPINLLDKQAVSAFIAESMPYQFKMVVFDTLSQCSAGADENSNRDMGIVVSHLNEIAHTLQTAVLVTHHTPKGGGKFRGAGVIKDNTYGFLNISKDDEYIVMADERTKNTGEKKDIYMRLVQTGDSCVIMRANRVARSERLTKKAVEVLERLMLIEDATGAGVKVIDLKKSIEEQSDRTFYRIITTLRTKRLIDGEDRKPLTITAKGRESLQEYSDNPEAQVEPTSTNDDFIVNPNL